MNADLISDQRSFAFICGLFLLRLLGRGGGRLRRVVELPRLDHVLFIVKRSIAININFDLQLVLLAVADVARIERETVLAA